MKIYYQLFIYLLLYSSIQAQVKSPEFETTFYFEDAVGNRDTITAGYDPEANLEYNPDFGEVDISHIPFDSTFEVRASHAFTWSNENIIMTKKIVMWTEPVVINSDCTSAATPIFFINVKHLPVNISWDKRTFLDAPCLTSSYLTSFNSLGIVDFWWDSFPNSYTCLAESESWTINFIESDSFLYYRNEHQTIEGVEGDTTILGVALSFNRAQNFFSPCRYIVDVDDVETTSKQISVFPNPTNDMLNFQASKGNNKYSIFDVTGKLVQNGVADNSIPVSNLGQGIYFIKIGEGALSKFLKK